MKRNRRKAGRQSLTKNIVSNQVSDFDRRSFVKLIPAIGAAAIVVPYLSVPATSAQTPSPTPTPSPSPSPTPTPLRVTKEMLHGAEQLFGIELTDAQKQMALQNANTNLERYETLRKINIPLDTEPATLFHPALPGKKFANKTTRFKLSKVEALNFSSIEELAFATVPQLAELIRK